jgi:hypothetical protein
MARQPLSSLLQVRIEQEIRDAFVALCEIDRRTPSDVVRRWIYEVVAQRQKAPPEPAVGPSDDFGGVVLPEDDEDVSQPALSRADRRRLAKVAKKNGRK